MDDKINIQPIRDTDKWDESYWNEYTYNDDMDDIPYRNIDKIDVRKLNNAYIIRRHEMNFIEKEYFLHDKNKEIMSYITRAFEAIPTDKHDIFRHRLFSKYKLIPDIIYDVFMVIMTPSDFADMIMDDKHSESLLMAQDAYFVIIKFKSSFKNTYKMYKNIIDSLTVLKSNDTLYTLNNIKTSLRAISLTINDELWWQSAHECYKNNLDEFRYDLIMAQDACLDKINTKRSLLHVLINLSINGVVVDDVLQHFKKEPDNVIVNCMNNILSMRLNNLILTKILQYIKDEHEAKDIFGDASILANIVSNLNARGTTNYLDFS